VNPFICGFGVSFCHAAYIRGVSRKRSHEQSIRRIYIPVLRCGVLKERGRHGIIQQK
jgi:hypothetical protein